MYHYYFFLLTIYEYLIKIFNINDELTKILGKVDWKSLFFSKTLPISISSGVFFVEDFSYKSSFWQMLLSQGTNTNSKWVPKIIKKCVIWFKSTLQRTSCISCFIADSDHAFNLLVWFSVKNDSSQKLGRI